MSAGSSLPRPNMLLVYSTERHVSELRVAGSAAGHCRCFNRPTPNRLLNLLIATGMMTLTAFIHFFGIVALLRLRHNFALVRLVPCEAEKGGKRNSSQESPAFQLRISRRECPVQAWARCRILRKEMNPNLGTLLKSACSDRKSRTTFAEHASGRNVLSTL